MTRSPRTDQSLNLRLATLISLQPTRRAASSSASEGMARDGGDLV
jgi:hypothetical protein